MVDHMEDSLDTGSPGVSDIPHLRHRYSVPDVPEDVDDDVLLHFNDPNWDFQANSSTISISTDGVGNKRWSKTSSNLGASTDVDTESHVSSWPPVRDSKADFSFSNEATQVQDSPYPEVRAAVANTDDPTMPVNTFRVWFIGLLFAMILPAFNTVILFRSPFVLINILLIQLVALPFGKFLEWALPKHRVSAFGYSFTLNPGPFNIKEHTLIAIMANVVVDASPVTDVSAAMRIVYGVRWPVGKQFFLGITVQLFGFSIAGALRPFLVWPGSMIWPGVLVRCALLNTMHSNYGKKETKHISRERFLYIAFACSFLWYWIPGYLWTGLSVFNWVCWIAPNNVVVNSLFGTISGLGMGILTLDWAAVTEIGSPLVVPWWAQLNMIGGFLVVIWFICPILWAKNVFFSQFMPISVPLAFDNTGAPYNLSAIVTNSTFDLAKYEQYSPMFLPITYAVTYGTIFAGYPAVIVHTFLWYRHDISRQFRRTLKDEIDIHAYLMRKYSETPHWVFNTLGVICFVLGVIGIEVCHTGLPVWAFVVSIILAIIFVLPIGIIQAITNQQISFVVMAELLVGYVLPGRPVATMVFKTMAGSTISQAVSFSSDLKFGHYMKIPPRLMFSGQVIASIVSVITAILAQEWALDNIPDICTPHQKSRFTCPTITTFNNSSVIWGAIGPKRFFSPGALYYPLVWFFLIGALLPIPFYYLARRYPRSRWRYVNIPVVLAAPNMVPPANGMNFGSWILVGCFFQWFMRRFHFRWWMRYNYLLSTGLDAGVIVGLVVIFFTLQMPRGGINVNWWGNDVWKNTADAQMTPLKIVPPGQIFGPSTWS
ncbi:OPT-domain-containing protein [Lactifluus subvellereus]|nr:OPT-domain-containing protein [Lactifluus subvellereus]